MMPLNERTVFLFDGIGALLSAALTGLLLPLFSGTIGIPVWILRGLAALPLAYAFYSFGCYRLTAKPRPWRLLAIIMANIFYCLLSGALVLGLDGLTSWGKLFLLGEIAVIIAVVAIELSVYRKVR